MYVPIDDGRSRQVGRVLVVEDSAALQALMVAILLDAGYIVETADNGREGLLAARARVPDIILSDLEMPEMDGFTLTRNIKNDQRFKSIPVVIHSSLTGETNEKHVKSVGADAYIAKFVAEELAETIRKALA